MTTSCGFDIFGGRAGQAAMVCVAAAPVFLAPSAGFVRVGTTPMEEVVTCVDMRFRCWTRLAQPSKVPLLSEPRRGVEQFGSSSGS